MSPIGNPALAPLNHAPGADSFDPFRDGDSCTSLGSLSGNPFSEGVFLNVQSKPSLLQLQAISSHHVEIVQGRIHKDRSFQAFYSYGLRGYLIFNPVNIVF